MSNKILDQYGNPLVKADMSNGAITVDMLNGSSKTMTEDKALKLETVYTCIRDKSETVGQLPLKLYRTSRDDGLSTQVKMGRTHRIFTKKPCDYLTMQGFLEMLVASLETKGAFYAYKEKNDRGTVMSIIPFKNQDNVRPAMDLNGNVYYTYTTNDGKIRDPYRTEDLLRINLFTLDGYTSVSPIAYNAQLLGTTYAQEDSYKELQEEGITSQIALATDNVFNTQESIERLKNDWGDSRGSKGVKKIPILENGLKVVNLKLSPNDADLLNHRAFSVNRICRIFRVPPEIAGIVENKTGASMTEVNEAYMNRAINPILVKVEAALNELLPDDLFIRFDRKAFYAGSPWKMVEAVERELKGGLSTVNEGRVDLGRDPVDGGDVFAVDSNNVTYGTWEELKEIQAQIYRQERGNSQPKPAKEEVNDEE